MLAGKPIQDGFFNRRGVHMSRLNNRQHKYCKLNNYAVVYHLGKPHYLAHYRVVVLDFLDKLYGDGASVESFKPRCLKLVREEMIKSQRFAEELLIDG